MRVLYYHHANALSNIFPPQMGSLPKSLENLTIISLIYAIVQISATVKWKTHNAARNFPEISQKVICIYRMYPSLTQTGVPDLQHWNTVQKHYMRNAVIHTALT